jgi:hypothetical protein
LTASDRLAVGAIVTTSPPLRDKIAFTVMGTSLEAPKL